MVLFHDDVDDETLSDIPQSFWIRYLSDHGPPTAYVRDMVLYLQKYIPSVSVMTTPPDMVLSSVRTPAMGWASTSLRILNQCPLIVTRH